jgi:hypothetical protein
MTKDEIFAVGQLALRDFQATWVPVLQVATELGVSLSTAHKLGEEQVYFLTTLGSSCFVLRSTLDAVLAQPELVASFSKRGRKKMTPEQKKESERNKKEAHQRHQDALARPHLKSKVMDTK